jgi:hypothetical protein
MGRNEALVGAARLRVRPVLMTALATIAALTPLAAGLSGEGGIISQSLGAVVIGGLLTATLLTLVIVPAVFSTFDSLGLRIGRLFGRHRDEPAFAGAGGSSAGAVAAPHPGNGLGSPRERRSTGAPPIAAGDETAEVNPNGQSDRGEDERAEHGYFDDDYELPRTPNGTEAAEGDGRGARRNGGGLFDRLRGRSRR